MNKRPRLLILGCGDVGMRLLPLLVPRFRVFAQTRSNSMHERIRALGAVPLQADFDQKATLARLSGLAAHVIHLAPPQGEGVQDRRTRNLLAILPQCRNLVYISTSGVYGDCAGAWVDETRPCAPCNARARRRVDAECVLRAWARQSGARLAILRVPGIYADNRLPLERLQKGTPALQASDDAYTNHIHADDLAQIIVQALFHARPCRVYHAVDDSELRMGEYFDLVADNLGLPRPLRLPREQLKQAVSPQLWSFMAESRRLRNDRIKQELRVRLRHATVADFFLHGKTL
jgi:nucleoside-diphosphate-sugar epimerase